MTTKYDKRTKDELIRELKARDRHVRKLEKSIAALRSFEKAIETMQLGVTITDLTGKIMYTNPADAEIHDFTVEELIGKDVRLFAPSTLWKPMKKEEISSMKSWSRESKNRKKNGEIFPVELKSDVVLDSDGNPSGIITTCQDITARKQAEEKIENLLISDPLTGLYNRRGFFTLAEHQLEIAKRQELHVFVLYADLDNLKEINDKYGHQEGDLAIVETSNIIRSVHRRSDIVARIGGDEFVVFPVGAAEGSFEQIEARLNKNLLDYNKKTERGYSISISVGLAYFDPHSPKTLDELIAEADKLMYMDKRKKKIRTS